MTYFEEVYSMKKSIHPKFQDVVFQDVSCGFSLLTKSSIQSSETVHHEGKDYPLVKFDISSQSHPFYTGKQRLIDAEGRAEKFRKKYSKRATAKK